MGIEKMKRLPSIILLLLIVLLFSCEEHGVLVDCRECELEEPIKAKLEIKCDANQNRFPTKITIYEGNIEDNCIYMVMSTSDNETTAFVTLNKKYTVTATYSKSDGIYTAVDSATPRLRYNKDQCDDPCYYVYDRKLNLRLRYTK